MCLVGNLLLGVFNVEHTAVDGLLYLTNGFLAKFDFEFLVFDFFGKIVEFVIVAHIVELTGIAVDEHLFVLNLVEFSDVLSFELFNFSLIACHTRTQTFESVFKVLHFVRQLATDIADAVDFSEDGLKFEECLEAFFYRTRSFCFLICCHVRITGI